MKKLSGLLVLFAIAMTCEPLSLFAQEPQSGHGRPEPPMAGIQWAKDDVHGKGVHGNGSGAGSSPNLNYHGGNIMNTAATTAIFWGQKWNNATFTGDKVSGLDSFYGGIGGSAYATTNSEYNDSRGLFVTTSITYNGHQFDYSAASGGNRTAPILAEVCKVITNPVSNGYYPVYVDV